MHKFHPIRRIKYKFGFYNTYERNSLFKKIILIFLLIIITASFFIYTFEKRIGSLAERIALSQLKNNISRECNIALSEIIEDNNIDIDTIITVSGNEDKTKSLSSDFTEINILKTELAKRMTDYLNENKNITCYIPSGAVISNNVLSGYGFEIPTRLIISGSAFADFSNSFTSAGINQTKYTLMLKLTVSAEIQTRFNSFNETVVAELPIVEKIIVGDVPNFMMNNK